MLTDGDEDGITISDRYAAAAHGAPGATDVLAYVDGTVAGAASVIVRDGRAALGGAVTLPAFRRRGLHAALIQWRLRQAARSGCDLATAAADVGSASARNLQRQGFVVAYTVCCVRVQSSTT
jgi:GNAT superfamily N-acetyltransferase